MGLFRAHIRLGKGLISRMLLVFKPTSQLNPVASDSFGRQRKQLVFLLRGRGGVSMLAEAEPAKQLPGVANSA